ncbi:unnamed protein product, partial [Brachionus calyciflorus]
KDLSVDEMYELFLRVVRCACELYVPKRSNFPARKNQPIWMDGEIKKLIRDKYKLWKKVVCGKRNERGLNLERFKATKSRLKRKVRESVRNYETKLAKESKSNPKLIYKYINEKLMVKPTVHSVKRADNSLTNDHFEMAEIFNKHFHSVFSRDTENLSSFQDRTD